MEGHSFWDELIQHRPMLFYRALFLLFGLVLGWLLWQKNKRERDFRRLAEALKRFHQDYGRDALLMHAKLQVLLTRPDLHLSPEAEELCPICLSTIAGNSDTGQGKTAPAK